MMNVSNETQLNELWANFLPVSFPKGKCIQALAERLNVDKRNASKRFSDNTLLAKDVGFLFRNFGIGHDHEKGFFFDQRQFDLIQAREDMQDAEVFGLSN